VENCTAEATLPGPFAAIRGIWHDGNLNTRGRIAGSLRRLAEVNQIDVAAPVGPGDGTARLDRRNPGEAEALADLAIAMATSANSWTTWLRTKASPTIMPMTTIVATSTNSAETMKPASSFQRLRIINRSPTKKGATKHKPTKARSLA